MRIANQINLAAVERKRLVEVSRSKRSEVRLVERCKIVLLAADGLKDIEIAEQLGITRQKVSRWRKRYLEAGLYGVEKDAPRSGRIPRIGQRKISDIIKTTTTTTPSCSTHWSTRTMAKHVGVSPSTISRIWRAHGLKPHLAKTFKVSNDPKFEEKLRDIVGLYLIPPEHAIVFSVDEKSQIQALDRTQPSLPMYKGRAGTTTHDYKRNGTSTLFAAMNLADGTILGECTQKHKNEQWIRFLNKIDKSTPSDMDIHIICDNYSTHKSERTKKWQKRHKRFHFHFTPTSASWLNMVERFFRDLSQNRLKRGVFKSVDQLNEEIEKYLEMHNANPKPFIWTAKASDILEKVKRAKAKLDKLHSA